MWVLFRRFKIREHERGLLFEDREFKGVVRPGRYFVWDLLRKLRVDVVSVRDAWLVHPDLDVIAKSAALGDEARIVDLKDHERAVVWVDSRVEAVLKPGLYALWTVFHDVRVDVFDAKARILDVDLREQVLDVAGQEIMTADKVTLRLNAVVTFKVADPLKAVTTVDDYRQALYREALHARADREAGRPLPELRLQKNATACQRIPAG